MTKKRAPRTEADEYQRLFWTDALKHLPHHAAVKAARVMRNDKLIQYSYRGHHRALSQASLKSYSDKEINTYLAVFSQAKLWHGTGRYQHTANEILDVLSEILVHKGLKPSHDSYAVMLGGEHMTSISATPLRIVARSYADMHGKGALEKNRYGSALWWVSYYYGPFYAGVFTRHAITITRQYKKWHTATSNADGERTWGKKVNAQAKHVWDVFGLGSDIPGNYPILLGLREQAEVAKLPTAIAKAEVRITHLIGLDDITHLEVPEENVLETARLLAKSGATIPVFPIELGEYVASKQSISELLSLT